MLSQVYYILRSRADGQYLVARPRPKSTSSESTHESSPSFLLLFSEYADALSYLNTHAAEVINRFAVESILSHQVGPILKRWDMTGIGVVQDPLLPRIEFMLRD